MGKLLQRYKKHGKAKTELQEVESMSIPSADFDIHATPLDEVVDEQIDKTINEIEPIVESSVNVKNEKPDEFKDHVQQLLASSKNDALNKAQAVVNKKPEQSEQNSESANVKSEPKQVSKEHYEIEAEKLGFNDLPKNLANSLVAWRKSNRPVVTGHQWNERLRVCRGCSHWMENKSTNMAKCMKCGCSSGKLLLASSNCPLSPPKWKSV